MNKHVKDFKLEIDNAVKKFINCENVEGWEQAAAVNAAIGYLKKLLKINEMPCYYRHEDEDVLQKIDYKEDVETHPAASTCEHEWEIVYEEIDRYCVRNIHKKCTKCGEFRIECR